MVPDSRCTTSLRKMAAQEEPLSIWRLLQVSILYNRLHDISYKQFDQSFYVRWNLHVMLVNTLIHRVDIIRITWFPQFTSQRTSDRGNGNNNLHLSSRLYNNQKITTKTSHEHTQDF